MNEAPGRSENAAPSGEKVSSAFLVMKICQKMQSTYFPRERNQTPLVECWKNILNSQNDIQFFSDVLILSKLLSKCEHEITNMPLIGSETRITITQVVSQIKTTLHPANFSIPFGNFVTIFDQSNLNYLQFASDILLKVSPVSMLTNELFFEISEKIKIIMEIISGSVLPEKMKSMIEVALWEIQHALKNAGLFGPNEVFVKAGNLAAISAVCEQNAIIEEIDVAQIEKIRSVKLSSIELLDWMGRIMLLKDGINFSIESSKIVPLLLGAVPS